MLTEIVDNVKKDGHGNKFARSLILGNRAYLKHRDDREELFDLAADPGQTRDLSGKPESRPILDQFRSRLADYKQSDDAAEATAAAIE